MTTDTSFPLSPSSRCHSLRRLSGAMQACRNEGWTQATAKSCASFVSHRMPWSPSVSQCRAKAINFRAIYTQTPALAGKALLAIKISEPPPPPPPPHPPASAHARASFRQARSPSLSLQDDIIPKACAHTFLQHRPSLSAVDWFKGSNAQPMMMSLNPKGILTLSRVSFHLPCSGPCLCP